MTRAHANGTPHPYGVRECVGHWHVTKHGECITTDAGLLLCRMRVGMTREEAEEAMARLVARWNRLDSWIEKP